MDYDVQCLHSGRAKSSLVAISREPVPENPTALRVIALPRDDRFSSCPQRPAHSRRHQRAGSADQQLAAADRGAGNVGNLSRAGFEALQDLFHEIVNFRSELLQGDYRC